MITFVKEMFWFIEAAIFFRREANARSKEHTRLVMQALIHEQEMRKVRAKLVAFQRMYPYLSIIESVDLQVVDDETLLFFAELLCLDKWAGTPSYDSMEYDERPYRLNWPKGPGAQKRFDEAVEWQRRNARNH